MNNDQILYLTRADMDAVGPTLPEIVSLLESCFRFKGAGKAVLPAKHWLERTDDRFYSAMSSYIPELGYAGAKWQSGDPLNSTRGRPYIQGLYILTEDQHGVPVAIMDSEWITGRRTAAASALAVRYMANEDASELAILGCGLQGRSHLDVLRAVMPRLKHVRAYDIRREAAESFKRDLGPLFNVDIRISASAEEAVTGADVIISGAAIKTPPSPVIRPEWLIPGAVGVSIDYDSYWTAEAIAAMDLVVTDDIGQIDHLREFGLFKGVPKLDGELSDLVLGHLPSRQSKEDNLLCFNLGIALEDLVTAVDIYKRAIAKKVGMTLPR